MSMNVSTVGNRVAENNVNKKKNNAVIKSAVIGGSACGIIGALSNDVLQRNILQQISAHPGVKSIKPLVLSDSKIMNRAAERVEVLSEKLIKGGNKILKSEIVKSGLKSFAKGALIFGGIAFLVNLIKGAKSSDKTAE